MRVNSIVVDAKCSELDLSNRQLARRIGVTPQFLLRLRRGQRTASVGTIERLAETIEAPYEVVALPHRPVKETTP